MGEAGGVKPPMPAPASPEAQRAALVMVVANSFAQPLMLSSVTVALPSIANDLALNAVTLSWIPLAFLLSSASTVLSFGRLADMFGRKRIFVLGALGSMLSSLLLALAPNGPMLIGLRVLQGISAAMLYATQAAIVTSVYPPERRGQALGMIASGVYFGLTAGPLLGGWLVEHFGWRYAFVVHLPLTASVLLFALPRVSGDWAAPERGSFDWRGALTYAGGIVALIGGATALHGALGAALLAVGVGLIAWFVREQRRRTHPLFEVNLFYTNRVFALSSLAALLMYTTTFSVPVLASLHLQYLKGLSATAAGLVMFAQPLVVALMSPLVGRLSDRVEPRVLATAGVLVTGLGLLALATLGAGDGLGRVAASLGLTGLGFSLFAVTNVSAIMGAIGRGQQGAASSAVAAMRVLGQVCSMGLVAMAFSFTMGDAAIQAETYPALARALSISFGFAAALCVPCALCSLARGELRPAA